MHIFLLVSEFCVQAKKDTTVAFSFFTISADNRGKAMTCPSRPLFLMTSRRMIIVMLQSTIRTFNRLTL